MNHFTKFWLKASLFLTLPIWLALSLMLVNKTVQASEAVYDLQKKWQFRVFLDDREIGYHRVTLNSEQQTKRVSVEADFKVKFLFFTAFRYQHTAEEVWSESCLTDIDAKTNNNGDSLYLKKNNEKTGFELITHAGEQALEGCVRSFAYWDVDLLKTGQLLNTQSGEIEAVQLRQLGDSVLEFEGNSIPAIKYRLSLEDKSIDLWYSEDMNWLALQSETEGGYQLSYYSESMAF